MRAQQLHLSYARWENALGSKDVIAEKKRSDAAGEEDSKLTATNIKSIRKAKLEQLFLDDEIMYEEELSMQGLAYRRERA